MSDETETEADDLLVARAGEVVRRMVLNDQREDVDFLALLVDPELFAAVLGAMSGMIGGMVDALAGALGITREQCFDDLARH